MGRGLSDGQVEALKWLAMASMFADHFGRLWLGFPADSLVGLFGRVAFPLFAIVLGLNLARPGDQAQRAERTAARLVAWCLVAVVPSIFARDRPELVNVLGTFALGAVLCWALVVRAPSSLRVAVAVLALLASLRVEYGLPGVLLVPAVFWWARSGEGEAGVMVLGLMLALAGLNLAGGWWALVVTLVVLPLVSLARWMPVSVPRSQVAFYLLYPLHLLLVGGLRVFT